MGVGGGGGGNCGKRHRYLKGNDRCWPFGVVCSETVRQVPGEGKGSWQPGVINQKGLKLQGFRGGGDRGKKGGGGGHH